MTDKSQIDLFHQKTIQILKGDINKPFTVSIMGQTGVGKSSLVNALFGTQFKTSAVHPCTKEIEEHIAKDERGHKLRFYDLPGIGETRANNDNYLKAYRQKFEDSDVVLWAIHADSRSFSFDLNSLEQILQDFKDEQQGSLLSKVTFILTKADLLKVDPWILIVQGKDAMFKPGLETEKLLAQKTAYCQEHFIKPYGKFLISTTYRENESEIKAPSFSFEKNKVQYRGLMDETMLQTLVKQYPEHEKLLKRLFVNYQIIPCSSLFRFNLTQLMRVVIDKLGTSAIGRFSQFASQKGMSKVPIDRAKTFGNIVAVDKEGNSLFDLDALKTEG